MSRPVIKGGKGGPRSNMPEPPKCPYHAEEMVFAAERLCWVCTHNGCSMVSWPKVDVEAGKPIIGRGEVELVKAGDMTFLRAGNVLIEVTQVLHKYSKVNPSGYSVLLYIESAVETDGYERKQIE